ncbi:serine/threonine-protein kinase [Mycobacterium sp. URHB0044]|uniref:serine/threonine-protein kinase n=1 Tax=Mycobacterium sp. URHB0044 TaxID=1380386 RepID=UPI00048FB69E|nr:serine/threonine-protein kinase [Mycobacterium sp. URHB0044]
MDGTPFGRYQLIDLLGRGGMGEVWRAHDTTIDRVVALKMLLPHYARDPDFEKRFRREARAAAGLSDPHVVPIYDVGEIEGRLFVTMRLINGVDLQTLLNNGPLEPHRAVRIIEQIAGALHNAHQAGLVHRDVKPSNILLTPDDFAYLIDFGIARAAGDTALTSANTTIGTWAYMAPERFSTGEVQPSSDVYALACVLYQCLTGHPPFPGEALEQVAVGHMVTPPPKPSDEHDTVPTAMDDVIATGLAKKPNERYPNAIEMAAAARRAITGQTSEIPPAAPVPPYPAYAQPWESSGESPTAPARFGAPPPAGSRRRRVLFGALAGVVLLIAGGVVAAVTLTRDDDPAVAEPPSALPTTRNPGPPPNTGPFTGVYRANFGPITHLNDVPGPDTTKPTDTYAVRSACRPTGCVATASRLSGSTAFASPMVFDEIGGSWLVVGIGSVECQSDPAAESWQVLTLQPRPDGTLSGAYTATTSNDCVSKRTVTFTRTGDVDVESLPDPVALPPRVVSPAEALHGSYHQTRTFPTMGQRQQTDFQVRTDCLRTGDRCMSFFHGAAGEVEPLVFGDGIWTTNTEHDNACRGGTMHVKKSGQYPLPQPLQNPITLLTGHGRQDQTQPCATSVEFDETFTRTGD